MELIEAVWVFCIGMIIGGLYLMRFIGLKIGMKKERFDNFVGMPILTFIVMVGIIGVFYNIFYALSFAMGILMGVTFNKFFSEARASGFIGKTN